MAEYKFDPMLGARVKVTSWRNEAEKSHFMDEGLVTDILYDKAHVIFDSDETPGLGMFISRTSLSIIADRPTDQPNRWYGQAKDHLPPTPSMSREEAVELERLQKLKESKMAEPTIQPFTDAEVTEYFMNPRHASRFTFYLSSIGYFMWDITYLVRENGEYVIKTAWSRDRESIVRNFDERPDLTLELVTRVKARCYLKTDLLFLAEPVGVDTPLD